MKRILQIILTIIFFSGCDGNYDYVRFETAQPQGKKELNRFDNNIQGIYASCDNSNKVLIISDDLILKRYHWFFKIHRNDLDLDSTITIDLTDDDALIKLFEKENYTIKIEGDTLSGMTQDIDTIFQISDTQILKKIKGSYFLNYQEDENYWRVNRLDLRKDSLFMGYITPTDTLLQFDFVTKNQEINQDSSTTTEYVINPTKKEFKQMVKKDAFNSTTCYYRKE